MFYIVNSETERIIGISLSCPDPQEQANIFECPIYIIEGEDIGLSAEPEIPEGIKDGT